MIVLMPVEMLALGPVGAPEQCPHIDTPRRRAVEHIEQAAATARHFEIAMQEGNGYPDAGLCRLHGFADTRERRLAIHQRAHRIATANR